jgi:hypothetical protein
MVEVVKAMEVEVMEVRTMVVDMNLAPVVLMVEQVERMEGVAIVAVVGTIHIQDRNRGR